MSRDPHEPLNEYGQLDSRALRAAAEQAALPMRTLLGGGYQVVTPGGSAYAPTPGRERHVVRLTAADAIGNYSFRGVYWGARESSPFVDDWLDSGSPAGDYHDGTGARTPDNALGLWADPATGAVVEVEPGDGGAPWLIVTVGPGKLFRFLSSLPDQRFSGNPPRTAWCGGARALSGVSSYTPALSDHLSLLDVDASAGAVTVQLTSVSLATADGPAGFEVTVRKSDSTTNPVLLQYTSSPSTAPLAVGIYRQGQAVLCRRAPGGWSLVGADATPELAGGLSPFAQRLPGWKTFDAVNIVPAGQPADYVNPVGLAWGDGSDTTWYGRGIFGVSWGAYLRACTNGGWLTPSVLSPAKTPGHSVDFRANNLFADLVLGCQGLGAASGGGTTTVVYYLAGNGTRGTTFFTDSVQLRVNKSGSGDALTSLELDRIYAASGIYDVGFLEVFGTATFHGDVSFLPGAIDAADLANLSVTTAKLDNLAVTAGKIADLAVTATKLAASAVTLPKIDDQAKLYLIKKGKYL